MSEQRIKQLAILAGLNSPHGSDHEGLRDFDYRAFAKLIITDCITVVDVWSDDKPPSEGYDTLLVYKLKQHFGIEE